MVKIDLPRPRTSEIVSSEAFGRYVAQIWSDLREEASRGLRDDEASKLHGGRAMSAAGLDHADRAGSRPCSGSARSSRSIAADRDPRSASACINRFIVPMPSEIFWAFPRIIAEEHVLSRFLLTATEAFSASILVTIFGVAGGVLLHQFRLLRAATETWVAAVAAAPLVLIYPLYLVIFGRNATTIVMMGFTAGLAPVILKTLEGLSGTRRVLINVGRSFNLTPSQQFWKILFPAALPTIFVGMRLGLIFALINIVGRRVPDQFRRARAAHQRARGAL